MARTKIIIDYRRCGDGVGVDPRDCCACLRACEPAVFLLHQTLGANEADPFDPQIWRVTPLWASLCTRCGKCVEVCPQEAIAMSTTGLWPRRKPEMSAPGNPAS